MKTISNRITGTLLFLALFGCRLGPFSFTPPTAENTPALTAQATALLPTETVTPAAVVAGTDTPLATLTLQPADAADRDRHVRIFRTVWRTVNRHYVYPTYNGTDWEAVREAYEPLVVAAPDDEHFWQLMQEMIERLQDNHSAYLSPDEVQEEDLAMRGDLDYVGIGVYVTVPEDAEYGIVLFPFPEGPAESAGVRPHDRILAIDGLQVCCDEEGYDNLDTILGAEGSTLTLTLQYPGEPARDVIVKRARIQTQLPILSRVITSTQHSDQSIGYVLIPTLWDETVAERTREVLEGLLNSPAVTGLIVDMRINGGGAYTELYDLLSLFTHGNVGAFTQRGQDVDTLIITPDPIANSQEIPMIILVGEETESYAEVFSGVLQAQERAILIGESTAGNVETVYPYDLEDGSRLWLAEETFTVPGAPSWEGTGVQPDIHVPGRWEDIWEEDDGPLKTALAVLLGDY